MKEKLVELYKHRELLNMITYRDLKVRYKQSVMGFLWAILTPILVVMAGIVVRYGYAFAAHRPLDVDDIASVAVKAVPWAFFVSSIRFGCNSLALTNRDLVTKIYFPKEIIPLASVLSTLCDLAAASVALVVLLAIIGIHVSLSFFWIPVLMAVLMALTAGVSMMVAAGSLFFRDVRYIVEIFLTFAIFFTPVFYDAEMFGDKGKWLLLNPVAPLLEGLSACIIHGKRPDLGWFTYSVVWASVSLFGGYIFFKHLEPAFAESI